MGTDSDTVSLASSCRESQRLDPDGRDVTDPYGATVDVYQECAAKISSYLDIWIDRLDQNSMPVWHTKKEN